MAATQTDAERRLSAVETTTTLRSDTMRTEDTVPAKQPTVPPQAVSYTRPQGTYFPRERIAQAIDAIGIKEEKFVPDSEEEFDKLLQTWENKVVKAGLDENVLKDITTRLADLAISTVVRGVDPSLPWPEWKNQLARSFFPMSRYRHELENIIRSEDRSEDYSTPIPCNTEKYSKFK